MHILIFWFTQEMEIKLLERQQQLKSELVCASTVSMCSWDSQPSLYFLPAVVWFRSEHLRYFFHFSLRFSFFVEEFIMAWVFHWHCNWKYQVIHWQYSYQIRRRREVIQFCLVDPSGCTFLRSIRTPWPVSCSNPGHPFAAGLVLSKLSAVTVDDFGKETFATGGDLDRVKKVRCSCILFPRLVWYYSWLLLTSWSPVLFFVIHVERKVSTRGNTNSSKKWWLFVLLRSRILGSKVKKHQ
jgi:hypothetical protein